MASEKENENELATTTTATATATAPTTNETKGKHTYDRAHQMQKHVRLCLLTANFSAALCIGARTYTLARTRIRTFFILIPFFLSFSLCFHVRQEDSFRFLVAGRCFLILLPSPLLCTASATSALVAVAAYSLEIYSLREWFGVHAIAMHIM